MNLFLYSTWPVAVYLRSPGQVALISLLIPTIFDSLSIAYYTRFLIFIFSLEYRPGEKSRTANHSQEYDHARVKGLESQF